jgi:hypothetical protein
MNECALNAEKMPKSASLTNETRCFAGLDKHKVPKSALLTNEMRD